MNDALDPSALIEKVQKIVGDTGDPAVYSIRLRRHFTQWIASVDGLLVEDLAPTDYEVDLSALLLGIEVELFEAQHLMTLPREIREVEITRLANRAKLSEKLLLTVMSWWREAGRKVRS